MNLETLTVTVKIEKNKIFNHLMEIVKIPSGTNQTDEFMRGYVAALEYVINHVELETKL